MRRLVADALLRERGTRSRTAPGPPRGGLDGEPRTAASRAARTAQRSSRKRAAGRRRAQTRRRGRHAAGRVVQTAHGSVGRALMVSAGAQVAGSETELDPIGPARSLRESARSSSPRGPARGQRTCVLDAGRTAREERDHSAGVACVARSQSRDRRRAARPHAARRRRFEPAAEARDDAAHVQRSAAASSEARGRGAPRRRSRSMRRTLRRRLSRQHLERAQSAWVSGWPPQRSNRDGSVPPACPNVWRNAASAGAREPGGRRVQAVDPDVHAS